MPFHPDQLPDLSGNVYIVTGATSGMYVPPYLRSYVIDQITAAITPRHDLHNMERMCIYALELQTRALPLR